MGAKWARQGLESPAPEFVGPYGHNPSTFHEKPSTETDPKSAPLQTDMENHFRKPHLFGFGPKRITEITSPLPTNYGD